MRCPYCAHDVDRVLESRVVREGAAIRRRRECLKCSRRFTTHEQIEEMLLMVVKKDGRREAFDREKMLRGMMTACEKRPVPTATLEAIADEVEKTIHSGGVREIPSREIGEMVIEALRGLDHVAYVRFASVYRDFQDIDQFKEIVDTLGRGARKGKQGPQSAEEQDRSTNNL
jgi:transcriptional repressor NrdR